MSKIQVVWFRDLQTWSVALQNTQKISSKFSLTMLREVLIDLTKTRIFVIDDNKFYQEPTISSKTNLITARKQGLGKEFKVKKRVLILPNDLVIAKMHTQNGLYAFAKESFASTTTFIPFEIIESKINKDYLFIILKMTLQRLQKFDSVKRETYTTDEILDLQIPLPPLEIQNKIVADIHAVQDKINALQEEEKRLKDEIEAYIYITLGLQKPQNTAKQKVFVVRFKDLERWDIAYNQSRAINLDFCNNAESTKTQYPLVALGEICTHIDTQAQIPTEKYFFYVGLENIEKGGLNFEIVKENSNTIKSASLILKKGYIYYSKLRPYLKKIFYYDKDKKSYASSELVGLKFKDGIFPKFVLNLLTSNFITQQEQNTSGARMPRVNLNDIKNFKIPLPPLDTQKEIVAHIEQKTSHIQKLTQERTTLRDSIESRLQEMLID